MLTLKFRDMRTKRTIKVAFNNVAIEREVSSSKEVALFLEQVQDALDEVIDRGLTPQSVSISFDGEEWRNKEEYDIKVLFHDAVYFFIEDMTVNEDDETVAGLYELATGRDIEVTDKEDIRMETRSQFYNDFENLCKFIFERYF